MAQFFQVPKEKLIKSVLFKVDEKFVLVLVRGDHEVNDVKLKNLYQASVVELASAEETEQVMGVSPGFLGPIGASDKVEIVADYAVQAVVNGICGANENDLHYIGVNPDRDFTVTKYEDIRFIQEGDPSPDGKGRIKFAKGIEVGHVFKLGTRYSEAMKAEFLDEKGKTNPIIMGCYGIGVSRLLSAVVEQFHDENGIIWPNKLAPFEVHLIPVNMKNEEQVKVAEQIYHDLQAKGYEVLYDDRAERPGVKFADSDLIGIPVRITIGKRAGEGIVEVKERKSGNSIEVSVDQLKEQLAKLLR